MNFRNGQPFVGASAFAHKGGMHTHAVARTPASYEHIDPAVVGNERRVLVSELSGQSTILTKTTKYAIANDRPLMLKILSRVQDLENAGYEFEAAEASFDLLVQKAAGLYRPWFERLSYRVDIEAEADGAARTEARVKVRVGAQGDAHGQRGRRSGQRAGRGAAEGVAADLPAVGGDAPGGLQGARGERAGGDGGAGAGGGGVARRRGRVGHGRRERERGGGELAGSGRRGGVQTVQGRRDAGRGTEGGEDMSTVVGPQTPPPPAEQDDPWRIGWRYVRQEGPDGQVKVAARPAAPGGPAVIRRRKISSWTIRCTTTSAPTSGRAAPASRREIREWSSCTIAAWIGAWPGSSRCAPTFLSSANVHVPWDRNAGHF